MFGFASALVAFLCSRRDLIVRQIQPSLLSFFLFVTHLWQRGRKQTSLSPCLTLSTNAQGGISQRLYKFLRLSCVSDSRMCYMEIYATYSDRSRMVDTRL